MKLRLLADDDVFPTTWHVACGLGVTYGFPLFAAFSVAGFLFDSEAFYWSGAAIFIAMFPLAVGLELLARSIVARNRSATRGLASAFAVSDMRSRLLSEAELQASLARMGFDTLKVFQGRKIVWIGSVGLILSGLVWYVAEHV